MSLTVQKLCWGHPVPGGSRRELFRDFDLVCPTGQFVVIIGGNGSGKSTLLNLLAGTLPASSGSIELEGRLISGLKD